MLVDVRKIEILMAQQGLNQKELGERCGILRQSISSILRRGRTQPKTIGKLALGLGVNVEELIVECRTGQDTA